MFTTFLKNKFLYKNKYKTHPEAIIISCYFNPQNSEYRRKAFKIFYDSIKHLNHKIIECVIGDSEPELANIVPSENRKTIYTKNLLWHKESLLNRAIDFLPEKYKYVFWIDADVIFTNNDWLVEGVKQMENGANIIQPFEYCVHLEKDELKPSFDLDYHKAKIWSLKRHPNLWRSFCANYSTANCAHDENYDIHGHVGFAWGAKRRVLDLVPLYDKALIGGADHIIAHAAAGHIPHKCITKSFTEDIENVTKWSKEFYSVVKGKISYVPGDLYHIWHGDIKNRNYLNRIVDFTPKAKNITKQDENGLYVTEDQDTLNYMMNYFLVREVIEGENHVHFNPAEQFIHDVVHGTHINEHQSHSHETIVSPDVNVSSDSTNVVQSNYENFS